MNKFTRSVLLKSLLVFCFGLLFIQAQAQTTVSGTVTDAAGEPLVGVNVTVQGTITGTITDVSGAFNLKVRTAPPFNLVFSYVGYIAQEVQVTDDAGNISISLEEETNLGQEVVVSASRVEEKILESSVAIEKMDFQAVQNVATSTFYESLQKMKGVEIQTQSFTFQSVNSRGFGATGNARVLQLIDGMDSQSITNNFSYGNLVGVSDLDVESVEFLPGPSSVLYGPGAINGTLLINSKSPFEFQGFSAQALVGAMNTNNPQAPQSPMYNMNIRYAKAFNNKFAFKINVGYVGTPYDWHASDFRNLIATSGSPAGASGVLGTNLIGRNNPLYDGVNTYGDDGQLGVGFFDLANPALAPLATALGPLLPSFNSIGGGRVSRTGYREQDLANYNAYAFKAHTQLVYRIGDNAELNLGANFNNGRTVYTGAGRFNVSNFISGQLRLELKGSNYFVRAYANMEDAGDSYDIQRTGQYVETQWKPTINFANAADPNSWMVQYIGAFGANPLLALSDPVGAHAAARAFADAGRPTAGSPLFNQLRDAAIRTPGSGVAVPGARFSARNVFYHTEVMYNFNKIIDPTILEIVVGAHQRTFVPNTQGTIFDDANTPNDPLVSNRSIMVTEAGAYMQLTKRLFQDRLKITGAARIDKNQNFEARFTPRLAAVLTLGAERNHNLRVAYQTGFRNPTMLNQWQNLQVGTARVVGGLPQFVNRFFPTGTTPINANTGLPFTFREFRPEFVQTIEFGYKALIGRKLFIDGYAYYNWYENLIVNQLLVGSPVLPNSPIFIPVNQTGITPSLGWGIGFDYKIAGNFMLGGNVSRDVLDVSRQPGVLTEFNTPGYRLNASFSNRDFYKGLGFNVTYRWQDSMIWESAGFYSGVVPEYHVFDAALSYKISSLNSIVRIGGSNLFNQRYTQAFGNPTIGSLYYVSITFDPSTIK